MYVQFSPLGPNPSWTDTSQLPIVPGESTNFIVAGMLPDTTYLMRSVLNNGTASAPMAYTTGSLPSSLHFPTFTDPLPPTASADPTQNMVFHMGIGLQIDTVATDLAGNINWYYDAAGNNFPSFATTVNPGGTVDLLGGPVLPAAAALTLREIDLAGDSLRETNVSAVNAELAAMGQEQIFQFDHEATLLPNGDTAVIASDFGTITVNGTPTPAVGNMVIVLDKNFQVVWTWNGFGANGLDTTRPPPFLATRLSLTESPIATGCTPIPSAGRPKTAT